MGILVCYPDGNSTITLEALKIATSSDKTTIYISVDDNPEHVRILKFENRQVWDDYIQFLSDPVRNKGCFRFDLYKRKKQQDSDK